MLPPLKISYFRETFILTAGVRKKTYVVVAQNQPTINHHGDLLRWVKYSYFRDACQIAIIILKFKCYENYLIGGTKIT